MITVTGPRYPAPAGSLVDDHIVLLWQTCAYAEDVADAAQSGQHLTGAFEAMLAFLHYQFLPYLRDEEERLPSSQLCQAHMAPLLLADHELLRTAVDNLESSRSRQLVSIAAEVLVNRLDHHIRREDHWLIDPTAEGQAGQAEAWAMPLLLTDDVDLDALPAEHLTHLVLARLQRMRPGETVRLRAGHDLHELWRRQHARSPDTHAWGYEADGPSEWIARITRRDSDVP